MLQHKASDICLFSCVMQCAIASVCWCNHAYHTSITKTEDNHLTIVSYYIHKPNARQHSKFSSTEWESTTLCPKKNM